MDGTLIEAWASMKSFRPKDGDPKEGDGGESPEPGRDKERDFHGFEALQRDPRKRYRCRGPALPQGSGIRISKLCFMGHALMENRNGLVVGGGVSLASGTAGHLGRGQGLRTSRISSRNSGSAR